MCFNCDFWLAIEEIEEWGSENGVLLSATVRGGRRPKAHSWDCASYAQAWAWCLWARLNWPMRGREIEKEREKGEEGRMARMGQMPGCGPN